jgi:hypothetical protein
MRYVPYLYFLRVPLISALIPPIRPQVGLWIGGEPNPMTGGFFDLTISLELSSCRTLRKLNWSFPFLPLHSCCKAANPTVRALLGRRSPAE